jgi:8-oxo-dGTP pyrophosphatase MutT (NUDIX family)
MSSRFERVEAQVVYEAKVATIMKGTFRHEDGDTAEREWAEMAGAVGIVAHDGERLWLVRQPREATGEFDLLELPAGRLDQEGETPLDTAKRELAEEIGKAAGAWQHLTTFYTTPGFTNEQCHIFLATELRDAPGQEIEGERIDIEVHPLAELDDLLAAVRDSKTLIGLLMLRDRLRRAG